MVMRVYSPEFKADAVTLYLSDPSHTYAQIGDDLGVSRETLRNWVSAHRARTETTGTTRKNVTSTPPRTAQPAPTSCANASQPWRPS